MKIEDCWVSFAAAVIDRAVQDRKEAQDKLLKGYVRQALGQSSSSLIRQGRKLAEQAAFYINTARGISSVAGSMFAWAPSVKYSE